MVSIWSDSKVKGSLTSQQWTQFDNLLTNQKITQSIHRTLRSVKLHGTYYKAMEALFFMLHCIPLFIGIMPELQLQHLLLLPEALTLLLGKRITEENLSLAYEKLFRFVWYFEDFYGCEYISLNVHNLLHLVKIVRRHGPLWCYSCFHFEAFNATILASIQGTNNCQFIAAMGILQLQELCRCENLLTQPEAILCVQSLMEGSARALIKVNEDLSVGSPVRETSDYIFYRSVCLRGQVIEASEEVKQSQFNNTGIRLIDGRFMRINTICKKIYNDRWLMRGQLVEESGKIGDNVTVGMEEVRDLCVSFCAGGLYRMVPVLNTIHFMQ